MSLKHKIIWASVLSFFLFSCEPDKPIEQPVQETHEVKPVSVPMINYQLVNTYLHDSTCYTQGFLFHKGQLLESTGAPKDIPYTRSLIGVVDLKTGKMNVKAEIDRNKYFGEGIAVLNEKIFQLTYTNQVGFIYDAKTFQNKGQFGYLSREGWGLTSDGKELIMSDGTNVLTYLDPEKLTVTKTVLISENGYAVDLLNELEYINGFIYANIYTTHTIVKIDPLSGSVVGKMDISALFENSKRRYPISAETNGIAYEPGSDKIYVTGKLWPAIYEISFPH